jgi:probable HAF family extracellular repeat protein
VKSKTSKYFSAAVFFVTVAFTARLPLQQQQASPAQGNERHRYKVVEIGTLGGPNSYFTFISKPLNSRGIAAGMADTATAVNLPFCLLFPDCFLTHAFLWKDGAITDLGVLPEIGGSFVNDINAKGTVTGMSLNGGSDPGLSLPYFDAVLWKDGTITDLGTFGGPLSYAGAINDHDQVVGFALNSTPDSFDLGDSCQNFPMPTQMHAFIWHRGVMRDLGTLGGTDSCALFINERGQVAGNSFTNSIVNPSTGRPTLHPFFWDGDEMKDLGTLGGTIAFANGINNRGQVAGASSLADDFTFHAFLWEKGELTDFGTLGGDFVEVIGLNEAGEIVGQAQLPNSQAVHAFLAKDGRMTDLGTPDGNACSAAISINAKVQIVGSSDDCFGNNGLAFLWENGHMSDLNTFVPLSSPLTLTTATSINDHGEIAAEGVLPSGEQRAVLLIPCNNEDSDASCKDDQEGASTTAKTTGASIVPRPAPATQPNLPLIQRKDRLRALWPNRRFRSYPQQ